jgi:hypothetical protein
LDIIAKLSRKVPAEPAAYSRETPCWRAHQAEMERLHLNNRGEIHIRAISGNIQSKAFDTRTTDWQEIE